MADPIPDVPAELLPRIGDALKGWAHLTRAASTTLPTNLHRANLIRRGALQFLNVPQRPHKT